jgi:YEATS domain-containing protein 4
MVKLEQVSEFGWGEFEAGIRIFFRDPDEQPIDLIHQIKLYPATPDGTDQKSLTAPPQQNSKKPVVSEQYDEVVFTDPTENFKRLLLLYSTFSADTRAAEAAGMVRARTRH